MSDWDPQGNDKAINKATKSGFAIVRTAPNLLLLDLDDAAACSKYLEMFPMVKEQIGLVKIGEWVSKSGEGKHVVLQLDKPLPVSQRMLLQAILGSDLKREMYNLKRVWDKESDPIVLFKPKKKGTFSKPKQADDI